MEAPPAFPISDMLANFKASLDPNNNHNPYFQNVEVKVLDVKKNRSLVAKKSFTTDQVLFKEEPLVSSQFAWNRFYQYKACDYCMKPLETAEENVRRLAEDSSIDLPHLKENCTTKKEFHVSCVQCGIEYCSNNCRNLALDMYHESLCVGGQNDPSHPYNVLMDAWRQTHLPPETTTIEIILRLIAMIKQSSEKQSLIDKLNNYESDLFNQNQVPHKLLNERFFLQLEGLRELTLDLFKKHLYVKECEPMLSEEGFRKLFSLIGRNSQGIGTSPLSVWVENCDDMISLGKQERKKLDKFIDNLYDRLDKASGSFLNSEGSGLYELQSMINHSCTPNAEIKFADNNNTLTLMTLKQISSGEEIFISYLDECELQRSRHSRRKSLKENYLFDCECERCVKESDELDVTSDEDLEEDDGSEEASGSDESMDN